MIRKIVASTAIVGSLVVGLGATAFAAPSTPKDPVAQAAKIAERCAKAPEVIAKIKTAQGKVADRIVKLEAAQAKAAAEGKAELAAKLADRIAKMKERAASGVERLATIEAKVAEKCATPAT